MLYAHRQVGVLDRFCGRRQATTPTGLFGSSYPAPVVPRCRGEEDRGETKAAPVRHRRSRRAAAGRFGVVLDAGVPEHQRFVIGACNGDTAITVVKLAAFSADRAANLPTAVAPTRGLPAGVGDIRLPADGVGSGDRPMWIARLPDAASH